MTKLHIIRSGDYKPNLYIDHLDVLNRRAEKRDESHYDFQVDLPGRFKLMSNKTSHYLDREMMICLPDQVNFTNVQEFHAINLKAIEKMLIKDDVTHVVICAVVPRADVQAIADKDVIKQIVYLEALEDGSLRNPTNQERLIASANFVIPMMLYYKYPNHELYTGITNDTVLNIVESIDKEINGRHIMEVYAHNSSVDSTVQCIFEPRVSGKSLVQIQKNLFTGAEDEVVLDLYSGESGIGHYPDLVPIEDFNVDTNLDYNVEDNKFKFKLPAGKDAGYFVVSLPFFKDESETRYFDGTEKPVFDFAVFLK